MRLSHLAPLVGTMILATACGTVTSVLPGPGWALPPLDPATLPERSATTPEATGTLFGNASVPRGADDTHAAGYALMQELGMTTIREGWNWKNVEVGKHQYVSWMDYFDQKAAEFRKQGVAVQAMVTDTPDWASSDPTYASKTGWDASSPGQYTVPAGLYAPIFRDGTDVYQPGATPNPDNYYASYLGEMVRRYRGQIGYWQVWNEPDFPDGDLGAGAKAKNGTLRYWAGSVQDYVRLLKISSVLVKGLDPKARVTLGGLGHPGYLAAILEAGGAPYFDLVDFHAYGSDTSSAHGVLDSDWGFLGRYRAMKQVLTDHGVTDKLFSCSETGMTSRLPAEQASYVAQLFASAVALGDMRLVQWAVFTNPGHDDIGLVDQATLTQKTAGYAAYRFASRQLSGARMIAPLSGNGVRGYRFQRSDGRILYVAWTTGAGFNLTLPVTAAQVLDATGQAMTGTLTPDGLLVPLSSSPVFILP